MALRTCRVIFRDDGGLEHAVEVTAESLYEAVAQGLRFFREDEWSEHADGAPTTVVVSIKQMAEVEHTVRIRDFKKWLDSAGRNPAEMALKTRLRTILKR